MTELEQQLIELKDENLNLREENLNLKEMCSWILKAQERAENPERRNNDYQETANEASELLRNPAFNTAYNDLITDIQRQILNSQPDQQEVRETCYLESQVLQRLLLKLQYQVNTASQREAERNNSQKL